MNPAVGMYRVGHWFHTHGMAPVAWGLSWLGRFLFAGMLPGSARIGPRFICGYWGLGVVIHKDAVIGADCLIAQNVTIGRNPGDTRVPVLGDRVYVGAGAVIIGEIMIGDDVIIGANSVVLADVPARAVVAGVPARLIRMQDGPRDPAHA